MSTYLVRIAGTQRLVGVFVAADIESLFWAVDEEVSPGDCECMRLRDGDGVLLDGLMSHDDDTDNVVADSEAVAHYPVRLNCSTSERAGPWVAIVRGQHAAAIGKPYETAVPRAVDRIVDTLNLR